MSGYDALRGIYLQVLGTLLKCLSELEKINTFIIEPDDQTEKVDFLINYINGTTRVVQVKSSKNPISQSQAENWADELEKNIKSDYYELMLFGPQPKFFIILPGQRKTAIHQPMNLDLNMLLESAVYKLLDYINKHNLSNRILTVECLRNIINSLIGNLFAETMFKKEISEKTIRKIVSENIVKLEKNETVMFSNIIIKNRGWKVRYNCKSFFLEEKVTKFIGVGDFGRTKDINVNVMLYNGSASSKVLCQIGIAVMQIAFIMYGKGELGRNFKEIKESKYIFKVKTEQIPGNSDVRWSSRELEDENYPPANIFSGKEVVFYTDLPNPIEIPSKDYLRFKVILKDYLINIPNNSLIKLYGVFGNEIIDSFNIHIDTLI